MHRHVLLLFVLIVLPLAAPAQVQGVSAISGIPLDSTNRSDSTTRPDTAYRFVQAIGLIGGGSGIDGKTHHLDLRFSLGGELEGRRYIQVSVSDIVSPNLAFANVALVYGAINQGRYGHMLIAAGGELSSRLESDDGFPLGIGIGAEVQLFAPAIRVTKLSGLALGVSADGFLNTYYSHFGVLVGVQLRSLPSSD